MEDIKKQAELYAESFRYKIDDAGWYEQKVRDFIAGYEAALRIHDVSGRSEQLVNFLLHLNDKELINNHDFDYEKEAKKYLKKNN